MDKKNLTIARVRLTDEASLEKPVPKPPKKLDYGSDIMKRVLMRKAMIDATEIFAAQDGFALKDYVVPPEDKAICDALLRFDNFNAMKALTEAIMGKKYKVLKTVATIEYNLFAAFVTLSNDNGNRYTIGEVAVSLSSDKNGGNSLDTYNNSKGNNPPERLVRNKKTQVRPATVKEIEGLSDKALDYIIMNSGHVLVPIEMLA